MTKLGNIQWVEINEDGTFSRVVQSRENIGQADDLLSKLAAEAPILVRSFAQPMGSDSPIIYLSIKSGHYHAWGILDKIVLNCAWRSSGGILTPLFTPEGHDQINLSLTWRPHETMRIFFLEVMDKPNAVFRRINSFLIASSTNPDVKGWLQLPLANTYDEGRLCLGREVPPTNPSIAGMWASSYNHFCSTRFNSDLAFEHTNRGAAKLFQFKAETLAQVPVPADWHLHCKKVNHSIYSVIQG